MSSGVLQLLGAVTGIVLARALGPEERGDLAAVVVWPTVLVFVGGVGLAEAAMYFGATQPGQVRGLSRELLRFGLIQGAGLAVITACLIYPLTFGYAAPWDSWWTTSMTLYYPLYFLAVYPMCLANGLGHHRLFHFWRTVPGLVLVATFAGLASAGALTKESAVIAYLVAQGIAAAAAWLLLRPVQSSIRTVDEAVSRRELLSYGWRSGTATAASTLNERLDQLAIAAFLAPVALGYYTIAWTITSLSSLASSAVTLAGIPSLASLDDDVRRQASRRLLQISIALALLVATPLFIMAPPLIELLFGPEFRPAVTPARILILASVVLSVNKALGTVLRGTGRPADVAAGETLGLVITAGALTVMVPVWGITGAATASSVAYVAVCLVLCTRLARWYARPVPRVPAPSAGR
jgi:O-antigen/teichoic acid export membrane protein